MKPSAALDLMGEPQGPVPDAKLPAPPRCQRCPVCYSPRRRGGGGGVKTFPTFHYAKGVL